MTGKRRQDLGERAAAVTAARAGSSSTASGASNAASTTGSGRPTPPRSKPVRITMDLEPAVYRELQRFTTDAADTLARTRVPNIAVIRALLAELLTNDELAQRIQDRLRDTFDD